MWEAGQKTQKTDFWMTDSDLAAFSAVLQNSDLGLIWLCSHASPDQALRHEYDNLLAAMSCTQGARNLFSRQAGTLLPCKAAPLGELRVRQSEVKLQTHLVDYYAEGYQYPENCTFVECGSISIRWNTGHGDAAQQAQLQEQIKPIWKLLNSVTRPANFVTTSGRPIRGYRIGPEMYQQAIDNSWYLHTNGPYCLPTRKK